ncbi:DNA primase, partial [Chloroflexota bacterium]
QYLLERDYSENEILTTGLVIAVEGGKTHDRFRSRLMFPITDIRGHTLGFGARSLDDSLPKYLNSPQTLVFDKSSCLYGANLAAAAIRQQDMAVVVEGYMDVITAHQQGFHNVVASMGISVTENQIGIIKKLTRNVVLALDADVAGEEAMLRGVSYENTLGTEVKVVYLPEGKDPDDVIKQDTSLWQRLLGEALPVVDYTFNMVTAKLDLTTARDKSLALDRLLPIIAGIKNIIRRDHYLQKLARLVKVRVESLVAELGKNRPGSGRRGQVEPGQEVMPRTLRPIVSRPLEEYCLALLLQHPELRVGGQAPSLEYFENSENREIFVAWQQTDNPTSAKCKLDTAIHEHFDNLITKSIPVSQIDQKYTGCVLRLRENYYRSLETKREIKLTLEAESGGTAAEMAQLEEEGIDSSVQLREVFHSKDKWYRKPRR